MPAKGNEQELVRPAYERADGTKTMCKCRGGDKGWNCRFCEAPSRGSPGLQALALVQIAVDVLDLNGCVVHQDADREGKAADRHHVQGLAEAAHDDDQRPEWRAEST